MDAYVGMEKLASVLLKILGVRSVLANKSDWPLLLSIKLDLHRVSHTCGVVSKVTKAC